MPYTIDSSIAEFVASLRQAGLTLAVEDDQLRVKAPKGVIDAEMAAQIRTLKPKIVELLSAEDSRGAKAPIHACERGGLLPLGFVQERMWVHGQLQNEVPLYNLPAAWRMHGPLDISAFQRAFAAFVNRHEVLRMRLTDETGASAQLFAPAGGISLEIEDLSDAPPTDLSQRLTELRNRALNLEQGETFYAKLFVLGKDEHVFYFMPHHVVWDGWSFDIFLRDLSRFYDAARTGQPLELPALPVQYADYAVWHRDWLGSGALGGQLSFWEAELKDAPMALELPTDKPRPWLFSHQGDWDAFEFPAHTLKALRRVAGQFGATPFMILLSAWFTFLSRVSGQQDILVAAPIQARQRPEVADLVGCFVNTIALRQQLSHDTTFSSVIAAVREQCVRAYEHQDAPIELLIERLQLARDPSRTPLFQAMFSHQQVSRRPRKFGDITLSQVHVNPGATPTDIMLAIMEGEDSARGVIHYSTDLFEASTIARMRDRFVHMLEEALSRPTSRIGDLPMITPEETHQVLVEWNATDRSFDPTAQAGDAFTALARTDPDADALICNTDRVSYGMLDARAGQIAAALRSRGVGQGDLVGVHINRSIDMIATMLAIWRVGAGYLPLDPSFPSERLRYMIDDSGAVLVVSTSDLADDRSAFGVPVVELDTEDEAIGALPPILMRPETVDGTERAYVLYTSGSTGRPKGVEIQHRALINFLITMAEKPGLSREDRLLAVTTISFDISILELFLPLSVGASAVIASRDDTLDGFALAELLDEHEISVMQATPATWRLLIDCDWQGGPGFKALSGGEALPPGLACELLERVPELWNMYGPTETTIWSTCVRITDPDDITIGRPIANTRVYVLDDRGQPVAPGLAGELWIGGEGVAGGYLGQPDLTAERFRPDPFRPETPARMYRTGDWARFLPDGRLQFQRRRDDQVKVRGFRIELGEIETALLAHDAISEAAVIVSQEADNDARIVAYPVFRNGLTTTGSELRAFLRLTLPDYMIPQIFIDLPELPKTANNKIDRKALPAPAGVRDTQKELIPPRTDMEKVLSAIWSEKLGVNRISITDNFFELGGTSLQVAEMTARLRRDHGVKIKPRAVIFETLEQLAHSCEAR